MLDFGLGALKEDIPNWRFRDWFGGHGPPLPFESGWEGPARTSKPQNQTAKVIRFPQPPGALEREGRCCRMG